MRTSVILLGCLTLLSCDTTNLGHDIGLINKTYDVSGKPVQERMAYPPEVENEPPRSR